MDQMTEYEVRKIVQEEIAAFVNSLGVKLGHDSWTNLTPADLRSVLHEAHSSYHVWSQERAVEPSKESRLTEWADKARSQIDSFISTAENDIDNETVRGWCLKAAGFLRDLVDEAEERTKQDIDSNH